MLLASLEGTCQDFFSFVLMEDMLLSTASASCCVVSVGSYCPLLDGSRVFMLSISIFQIKDLVKKTSFFLSCIGNADRVCFLSRFAEW